MGARPRAGRSLAARMDNGTPLGGFGPLVPAYHQDRAGSAADNRIGDAPLDGSPYPPVAPATHYDQAYPELLGQGHDIQIHHPQPEVSTGHRSASDLHPPRQLSEQLPRLLFDLFVELVVVAECPGIAYQETGYHSDVDHVQLGVSLFSYVYGPQGGQLRF